MPNALIRYNANRSAFDVTTPEGEQYDPLEFPEDCITVLEGEEGGNYILIHDGYESDGGLKPDTLYRLVEVPTTVEEGTLDVEGTGVIEEDDEDDDDPEPEEAVA